jgi:hypothetical protein
MVNQRPVPKGSASKARPGAYQSGRAWTGYTPAGQRLVVEREEDVWVVACDDREPVRSVLLDVALVEALRSDVGARWYGIDSATWTRLIADSILSSWPKTERGDAALPSEVT